MEPIRNTKTARLRRLKMYREDLDELVALFQRSCSNVRITDGKNRCESLDEMKAHVGSKINDLDIRGERPGVHFLLNQQERVPGYSTPASFNELRTEEITDEADMLFFRIKDFLGERQQPSVRVPFVVLGILAIAGVLWFGEHNTEVTAQGQQIIHMTVGLAISMVVLLGSIVLGANVFNYVSLETRLNSQSFLKRNQEAFMTHAITSAIGIIVGYIFGHFLK